MPITDVIIEAVGRMDSCQTMKGLNTQNREKFIYYPTNWISGLEYKKYNNPNNQDIP